MTKLHDLHAAGQSVWIDYIRRDMLTTGSIHETISDGVRGLTSNPSIFQSAIGSSEEYDDQINQIMSVAPHTSTESVFEQLAVLDIQGAADALRVVYDMSNADDGYVSLEVSPRLANDTEGTITEARRLWSWVHRPNVLIKVPATAAGIPAIETLLAEGINVNATLMFSMEDYENVAQAYVRGVTRASDPSRIASVASFFVSRVDTSVDAALEKVGSGEAMEMRGTIAVANAKLAYARYEEIFGGETFADARERGASPQRVLWASTSTKNPEYDDVLYVETLIGHNTVNTMPPQTLDAFVDHGEVVANSLASDVVGAVSAVAKLAELGIDFDEITAELQHEGVVKFADSYSDLLATLDEKIETLR